MTSSTLPAVPVAHPDGAPWDLSESAAYLRVSKRSIERAIIAGRLKCVRIGRRKLVPDYEVRRAATEGL